MDRNAMIWFSVSELKIMTAKHVLSEAGIAAFTIDKKDSAHAGLFGDIELYVGRDDALRAKNLLIKEEIIEA